MSKTKYTGEQGVIQSKSVFFHLGNREQNSDAFMTYP